MATLRVRLVRLPLLAPFRTSFGTETERRALILEYRSGGVRALGECVTSENPYYGYEDNDTALHVIRDHLAPALKGDPSPGEFMERVSRVRGHNMAKASVEMMLWDLRGKRERKPLQRLLGESKGHAEVGVSLGMERTEEMVKRVGDALARGYRRVKLKVERGRENEIVRAVRDAFPDAPLSADANSCYTMRDLALLRRLDRFDLAYLEQPLEHDDLLDHAKLAKELSTPICLDESVSTVERARQAFEIGAAKVVNIKPGRVGGLANSLEVARVARENGGHAWVGGMLETGIGRAFNVALASLKVIDYPGDTSPNEKYFSRDIVRNPFRMEDGLVRPNEGDGCGAEVDDGYIEKRTLKSWRL